MITVPAVSVWLHPSLSFGAQAALRRASLAEGRMHHAFHYLSARQSALWMALHRAHSPATEGGVASSIYEEVAATVARASSGPRVRVVALGCGGSWKDLALLRALQAAGREVALVAVDASPFLAAHSVDLARAAGIRDVRAVAADLLTCEELLGELRSDLVTDEPTVVTAYGLLPNFEPDAFFGFLRRVVRVGEPLLLSANLVPEAGMAGVQAQYDNPQLEAWVSAVLSDWGLAERVSDYRLEVRTVGGWERFEASVAWRRTEDWDWEGCPLSVTAGERLPLFFSYRCTPPQLETLARAHGFAVHQAWIAGNREELVYQLE
jgi:hypothetical protein